MRKLIDLEDPFFAPLWIRVLVVVIAGGWGLFEFSAGAPMWGMIFLGISAICAWRFATIEYGASSED